MAVNTTKKKSLKNRVKGFFSKIGSRFSRKKNARQANKNFVKTVQVEELNQQTKELKNLLQRQVENAGNLNMDQMTKQVVQNNIETTRKLIEARQQELTNRGEKEKLEQLKKNVESVGNVVKNAPSSANGSGLGDVNGLKVAAINALKRMSGMDSVAAQIEALRNVIKECCKDSAACGRNRSGSISSVGTNNRGAANQENNAVNAAVNVAANAASNAASNAARNLVVNGAIENGRINANAIENGRINANAIENGRINANAIENARRNVSTLENARKNMNAIENARKNMNAVENARKNMNAVENAKGNAKGNIAIRGLPKGRPNFLEPNVRNATYPKKVPKGSNNNVSPVGLFENEPPRANTFEEEPEAPPAPSAPEANNNNYPPPPQEENSSIRGQLLKRLGLNTLASESEIQRAFRKASVNAAKAGTRNTNNYKSLTSMYANWRNSVKESGYKEGNRPAEEMNYASEQVNEAAARAATEEAEMEARAQATRAASAAANTGNNANKVLLSNKEKKANNNTNNNVSPAGLYGSNNFENEPSRPSKSGRLPKPTMNTLTADEKKRVNLFKNLNSSITNNNALNLIRQEREQTASRSTKKGGRRTRRKKRSVSHKSQKNRK